LRLLHHQLKGADGVHRKLVHEDVFCLADEASAGQRRLKFLPPIDRHHHTRSVGGEHGADHFAVSVHCVRFSTEAIKSAGATAIGVQLIRPNAAEAAGQRGTGERGPPLIRLKVVAPNNRVIDRCRQARPFLELHLQSIEISHEGVCRCNGEKLAVQGEHEVCVVDAVNEIDRCVRDPGKGGLHVLLLGGRNIWHFVTQLAPATVRQRVRGAGAAGFHSLTGYVRATSLVALVDAAGIGTGLAIMGIPLALPLASLVFLGAFIPLVGAVLSGFFAVVVALLAKGFVYALITLGLVIAVMQLEGHVLQPLVMGRAVSIHPLAVVLGISVGGVIAGIVGALLAVPTIAFFNSAARVLLARDPVEKTQQETGEAPILEAEPDGVDEPLRSR